MSRDTGESKPQPSLAAAYLVCATALLLPGRIRIVFTLALNFFNNRVLSTSKLFLYFFSRRIVDLLMYLGYFLVVGPVALCARLAGNDYMGTAEAESFFQDKEPADEDEKGFARQY